MKNDYFPSSMDLDIFLEGNEVEELRQKPLEMDLMEVGKSLDKKLIVKYENFKSLGDGIEVIAQKTDPEGGWNEITAFEVKLNERAYSHLKQYNRTGSRHGLGAHITIHGPEALGF